ncbi:MAG: phospholipid carrier-dependent glycosyltransferase [bacterium]
MRKFIENLKLSKIILVTLLFFPFLGSFILLFRRIANNLGLYLVPLIFVSMFFSLLFLVVYKANYFKRIFQYKKRRLLINILTGVFLFIVAFVFRLYLIKIFPSPPASDSFLAFEIAKKWVDGPSSSYQHFFFQHWGIYALALSKGFLLFGKSLLVAKTISVLAGSLSAVIIYAAVLKSTKKYGLALISGLLLAMWPSFALYSNFLSGEHCFILFFSLSLLSLAYTISYLKDGKKNNFYLWVVIFSISLAIGNVFKEMTIITIPASILVFNWLLSEKTLSPAKFKQRLATKMGVFFVIIFCSFFVTSLSNLAVSYYAKGPINKHKTGFFIATGLNLENAGRYNSKIADEYTAPLLNALDKGYLSDKVYKVSNDAMMNKALQNASIEIKSLPKLFLQKFNTVWSNESEINNWNYDNYTLTKSSPDKESLRSYMARLETFNRYSNVFLFFIVLLSMLGTVEILRSSKDLLTPTIYFSTLTIIGFSCALLIIEVLTRYRSVLYPAIAIMATYGFMALQKRGKLLSKNKLG